MSQQHGQSSSTTPNITVTGLTNGSSYDFRVTPRNNDIFGSTSSTVTATPVIRTVFVSPTPTQSSTITTSYFTASASTSLATASLASSTQVLRLETGGGSLVSQVSTTTRYGDYNVTHLVNTLSGSDLSLGNNSSGIAYVGTTDTLYIVHNNTTGLNSTIDEVDKNGALLRQIVCTACGDIEGIVLISSVASTTAPGTFDNTFMLSSENDQANAEIYRVVINSTGTTPVNKNDYFDTGITHGSNSGLEGIAYNPASGVFYVAREHTSPALYEVTLGVGHSATSVQICSGLTLGAGVNDFTDLFYKNGVLFVGSEDATSRIIPINITSTSSCAYVDSDGDSDVSATDTGNWLTVGTVVGVTDQIEGLTWDDTGDMLYVLGEADFLGKYRSTVFTTQNIFSGLADGNYVLKASSLDTNGITSSSTDRAFTISTVAVSTSTVTSQAASNLGTSTARFNATLTADGNASSTNYGFEYGPTTSYGTILNTGGSLPLGAFYRDVTGLTPATTYHYRAFVTNSAGTASSTDQMFTTSSLGDTTAPNLSSIASSTTAYTATIQWDTNEPATPQVNYGLTAGYGSATSSSVLGTTHSLTIANLTPSTTYHFQITAQDPSANSTSSVDYTFRTIADVVAPVVSNLVVTPNQSGATLTWTTNEHASSSVSYGTSTSYASTSTSTGNTSHSATISGFDQGVVVHYSITAQDLYGNVASTSDATFTTLTAQVASPTSAPVGPLGGSGSSGGSTGGPTVNTPVVPQQAQVPAPVGVNPVVVQMFKGLGNAGVVVINIQAPGRRNAEIINIQKILNVDPATRIASKGPGSPGKETNLYGPATKAAVAKFQLKYGIVKSSRDTGYGVVGPKTRAKMNELLGKK